MIEWWPGRHSSSMRSGLCVELWSGHGDTKNQSVVSITNACFNVEAVIEIEGFKVGPKRSHVALRNLRIERSKSRSSSNSSSSSEPVLSTDFELALVFDKPGQYTLPITDITRIRCKYLQQGKASIEAKGSLILLNAVSHGDLERLLLFIRDVKTGKLPVESRSCVACREKGHKVKHKREELQSSEILQTFKLDGYCQARKKKKTKVLDCILRKRQLLHVTAGQDQVLKQLRDLKNRDHAHKSKKMGMSPGESEERPYVPDTKIHEASSKFEDRFQDEMRQYGRDTSASRQSPQVYNSRGSDRVDSKSASPRSRSQADERSRRVSEDVRRRERPGSWSKRRREKEIPTTEGEEGKENFKGEEEVRKIGEETVRRLAEERRRVEDEKRKILEEQRRRVEDDHRRVQEEQRKRYEDERRRREEVRRLEEEERRLLEESERKTQDDRRRKEEKERQKEELKRFVEEQERKRKEERERRALDDERRRKEEEEKLLQELMRQKQEEERLRKDLERRLQEQEQLRKQEEERRRKEEEDQRLFELRRQREDEERQKREQERRLQEHLTEQRRRQEEEKKRQEALRRQKQDEERQLQEKRKQEELRRQRQEEERRRRQEAAATKLQEDSNMRAQLEEERKKQEETRRRVLDEQREKLEQRRLDEEMRKWQHEEDHRRAKEDKWTMSDQERMRLEEQRHRVEEVMKMTRDLARKRMEENVKEEEKRKQAEAKEKDDEEFCRKFLDDDKRTLDEDIQKLDEDIQKLVDKANNVAGLEDVLMKLRERCSVRSERNTSDGIETPVLDPTKGMSYLFTRLEEKKKALKDEQERVRTEEARLNSKVDNSADSQVKAERLRQEELKRQQNERKKAEKAANALKKKLLQEQLRAAKLEARRLERVRKEAEKRAKAEERAKQQQKARKQAQEQARQYHYPAGPQRWPSYKHRPLTYQEYEDSWNVMKSSRNGASLGYADIPWPPAGNPLFIESGDSLDIQRRKLRIALLRWHPDKFMAICGDRLGSTDRDSIETQAKHLAQQVIQWKSRLEQA